MRRPRHGFTLVELLVVMAVIVILATMLYPGVAKARSKANQTVCLSNVRQLSMAILMYAQDYGGRLLPAAQSRLDQGAGPETLIWPAYLAPYAQSTEIFICPEAKGESFYADTWAERGRLSIGLNRDLEERTTNTPYPLGAIDEPATTILLADSTPGDTNSPEKARGFQVQADRPPNTKSGIGERHNGGTNVGFLDGHARWYPSSRIWQLDNPAGLRWRR